MDGLVSWVPGSGQVHIGGDVHPCRALPGGHLLVYGHELRPLTLADCELLTAWDGGFGDRGFGAGAGAGDQRVVDLAALVCQLATVAVSADPVGFGADPARIDAAVDPDRPTGASSTDPMQIGAAVEAVALFLAGAAGVGGLRGRSVDLIRLGVPAVDALSMTVLAADVLTADARAADALAADALAPDPKTEDPIATHGPAEPHDGWTTFEIAESVPPARAAAFDTVEALGTLRVRDELSSRLMRRLVVSARTSPPAAPAVLGVDRWGSPVIGSNRVLPEVPLPLRGASDSSEPGARAPGRGGPIPVESLRGSAPPTPAAGAATSVGGDRVDPQRWFDHRPAADSPATDPTGRLATSSDVAVATPITRSSLYPGTWPFGHRDTGARLAHLAADRRLDHDPATAERPAFNSPTTRDATRTSGQIRTGVPDDRSLTPVGVPGRQNPRDPWEHPVAPVDRWGAPGQPSPPIHPSLSDPIASEAAFDDELPDPSRPELPLGEPAAPANPTARPADPDGLLTDLARDLHALADLHGVSR